MRNPSLVARKTPHLLLAKTPEFSSPLGEGEAARPFEEIDTDARPLGYAKVSQERALRNLGLGARKTPHRIPAGTPESASPPGEGEEGRRLDQIDMAHSLLGLCKGLPGEARGRAPKEAGVLQRSPAGIRPFNQV